MVMVTLVTRRFGNHGYQNDSSMKEQERYISVLSIKLLPLFYVFSSCFTMNFGPVCLDILHTRFHFHSLENFSPYSTSVISPT